MKKLLTIFVLAISLIATTACSQESLNTVNSTVKGVQYATSMLAEVVPLTSAYAGLHNLYLNPLSYMDGNWKTNFDKYDDTIETSYEKIKGLEPPASFQETHSLLLTSLESTIAVNDMTEDTIAAGGQITAEMTKQFDAANTAFQSFLKASEQLKTLQ